MKPDSLPLFSEVKAAAQMPPGWPVLRLGFRPFYIGGALLAALIAMAMLTYMERKVMAAMQALPTVLQPITRIRKEELA